LVECLLAIGTELIAALRKQYVTGDDVFLLLLHFVDLALLSRTSARTPAAIPPSACRVCFAIRTRPTSAQLSSKTRAAAVRSIFMALTPTGYYVRASTSG
jgi:hypothetical protein